MWNYFQKITNKKLVYITKILELMRKDLMKRFVKILFRKGLLATIQV